MKILHFADAHIDHAQHGKMNHERNLPQRVVDFERSLITIVDTAIAEKVDLVLFAGDAYKDRSPLPTYQKLFESQIYKLSAAKIHTILLTGNHDMPKAQRRAHALQEFETLKLPYIHVVSRMSELTQAELELPVRVIGVPWIYKDRFKEMVQRNYTPNPDIDGDMEDYIAMYIQNQIDNADPNVIQILLAHATVVGAVYGDERNLMIGGDQKLPSALVRDERLDYVALGHIHKAQNMNGPGPEEQGEYRHPPAIYSGSIERLDFGERSDKKYFVIADVQKGKTEVSWRELKGIRPFYNLNIDITDPEDVTQKIIDHFPPSDKLTEAYLKVNVNIPMEWANSIIESEINVAGEVAFNFKLLITKIQSVRTRLGTSDEVSRMTEKELLEKYLQTRSDLKPTNLSELLTLADEIITTSREEIE